MMKTKIPIISLIIGYTLLILVPIISFVESKNFVGKMSGSYNEYLIINFVESIIFIIGISFGRRELISYYENKKL